MQSFINTCEPRQDIIQGSFNPEIFTASISQVASAYSGKGSAIDSIYSDAEAFFREATFPTEGLRRVNQWGLPLSYPHKINPIKSHRNSHLSP